MSGRIERWLEAYEVDSLPALLAAGYQVPTVLLLMGFMLWSRLQSFDNFVRPETVYFGGNDAYYHLREVSYAVRHWPFTMGFDPWTRFPYGNSADQFGTLFDQLIATAALVVGLGSPSQRTVALTVLVAPAVFGALVAVPVYFLGKRLGDRPGGVFAVFLLALIPGTFFQRTTVGFSDHHAAEVLFQSTAVLATMAALTVAEREKPVYEQFLDRDWAGLRTPLLWSGLSGVALGLYLWTWPPAVVLVGILGVFYLVALSVVTARGRSPEHLALVGVVSMAVAFVMTVVNLDTTTGFGSTSLSPLQLVLIAAVAAGTLFLAALGRVWDKRELPDHLYPVTVGGLVLVGVGAVSVVLPRLFRAIVSQALRNFGFGQSDTVLTIAEAKSVPFDALFDFMMAQYGLLYLSALVGLLLLVWDTYRSDSYRAELLLVVIWSLFTTSMALTQVRFNYYLAIVVVVLNVWLFDRIARLLDLPDRADQIPDLKAFQILVILAIGIFVLAPLAPPFASGDVVTRGQQAAPGPVVTWTESLDWMESNTPEEGRYAGSSSELAYYGRFARTDDYAYPEGAYGVMSWWDYGHWITVVGERIPDANPFQQGPRPASAFLLSANETRANLILEALPSFDSRNRIHEMTNEELRETIEAQSPQQAAEDTRYVVIDDQMAAGKFSAIATWTGPGPQLYFSRQEFQVGDTTAQLVGPNDAYHETMLAKLYYQDAQGLSHYRLVHETERESIIVSVAGQTAGGGYSETNFINRRLNQQVFTSVQQRPDLSFYAVQQDSSGTNPSRVKTYERVPGATLTGQVNTSEPTIVFATVQLQTNTGRNFTYVQQVQTDVQGNLELTVPYATTNTVGPAQGGTDLAVVAQGDYELLVGNPFQPSATATVAVPEPAVYAGETITVEFEPVEAGNQTVTVNASDDSSSSSLETPSGADDAESLSGPDQTAGHLSPLTASTRRPLDA